MTDNDFASPFGVSRRTVLAVGAVGASTVALAACSKAKTTSSAAATTSSAGSDTAVSTPPASSGAPSSSDSSSGGKALAKLDDIKVGEAIAATGADGAKILISRPTATTVAAFSAICTHMGCTVAPAGQELDCPCHGSKYDISGRVFKGMPAPKNLAVPSYTISADARISIGVDSASKKV